MKAHSWEVSPKEAIEIQKQLRKEVQLSPITHPVQWAAGVDLSYNIGSNIVFAAFVILDIETLEVVGRSGVKDEMDFPYIPGLLSFREIPSLMRAWKQLNWKPDVILVDGQGIAHPRRMGLATHLGILTEVPTIGCAKNLLVGKHELLGEEKGTSVVLVDREEKVGYVLRTKTSVKPMYISPGHLITLEESRKLVLRCMGNYRMPEPTRQAHLSVNAMRRGEIEPGRWLDEDNL